jgi:hypothetical protein
MMLRERRAKAALAASRRPIPIWAARPNWWCWNDLPRRKNAARLLLKRPNHAEGRACWRPVMWRCAPLTMPKRCCAMRSGLQPGFALARFDLAHALFAAPTGATGAELAPCWPEPG